MNTDGFDVENVKLISEVIEEARQQLQAIHAEAVAHWAKQTTRWRGSKAGERFNDRISDISSAAVSLNNASDSLDLAIEE